MSRTERGGIAVRRRHRSAADAISGDNVPRHRWHSRPTRISWTDAGERCATIYAGWFTWWVDR